MTADVSPASPPMASTPARLLLAALTAALLLAGCIGYPAGSIRPGDSVTVQYTATDLATGQVLAKDATATFVAGSGASGLGHDLENAILGLKANDTFSLDSRGDTGRAFTQTALANAIFDSRAAQQIYNTSAFAQAVGEPVVGMQFHAYGYNATLTNVTPQLVSFTLIGNDGFRQPFPDYGLTMVYSTQDGKLVKTLEPTPGVVFTLTFAGQVALDRLNPDGSTEPFPAGTYRVQPAQGTHLVFDYSPATNAALIGHDVSFQAKIVQVQPGAQTAPGAASCANEHPDATPCYGLRHSPQLQGDPSTVIAPPPASTTTAAP